jgi:ferredoxin/flavodoxin---NADP+ reductase
MTIWNEGRVVRQQQWTDSLFSIHIEVEVAPFNPGQFCRIALEIDGKVIARPYSFVNAPDNPIKEFYYINVEGGLLTPKLVELKPDDTILVAKKGAGIFTLNQVKDADTLWCFATGTALGVYLSILKTQAPWQRFKNIVLVHAVRAANELTHQDVIGQFASSYGKQFTYIPFVSRESAPNALEGRIPAAIADGRLCEKAGLSLTQADSSTMICGNPHMVQDTMAALKELGLSVSTIREPGQITIENYWKE